MLIEPYITIHLQHVRPKFDFFLFPYIALISAFAAQMALLGFIFPLFISPELVTLWSRIIPVHVREREVRRKKKKKKAQKKAQKKTTSP